MAIRKRFTVRKGSKTYNGGEIVSKVPKGYARSTGATTAPNGYEWYNNQKSKFAKDPKKRYKSVLVKGK